MFWFLFSHRKSLFDFSRLFYLPLNEKVFLIKYMCCIETRFSRCLFQEFTGFMVIAWFIQLWICWHYLLMHQGKSFNFSHYVALIKPRSHRSSGVFFYMWEIPFTLVFTWLFSWYFKIMWPQVCFSVLSTCKVSQKCRVIVIVARRRELSQKPNLCLWGAWKFFPKYLCTVKSPDNLSLYQ